MQIYSIIMHLSSIPHHEHAFILAGDIGGTNTNIALMEAREGTISCVKKFSFSSSSLNGIEEVLESSLKDFLLVAGYQGIRGACFTVAGPVEHNYCQLTNLQWSVDGNAISKKFGFPVFVINDLSGISFGLPLLNPADSSQLIALSHADGTVPEAQVLWGNTEVRAVLAPGTGLGIGYLINQKGRYLVLPSEGGHMDWAAFSDETRELQAWLQAKTGRNPGTEQFISGTGLENIFEFAAEKKHFAATGATDSIRAQPQGERAPLISHNAATDALCRYCMELFVEIIARFASSLALWMLPKSGLYLAGGIPSKNLNWFVEDKRFMRIFLENYRDSMKEQLLHIPVYLVIDYGINLYGAAHAWFCLSE